MLSTVEVKFRSLRPRAAQNSPETSIAQLRREPRGGARNARGAYGKSQGKWPIDEGLTDEYIPKLQAHLKTLPGGDALADKVKGWGVFKDGSRNTCYVDPDANNGKGKCYRGTPKVVAALTAEASA